MANNFGISSNPSRDEIGRWQFQMALSMKESWFRNGRALRQAAEVLLEQLWHYKKAAELIFKSKNNFDSGDPDLITVERSMMEPQISMLLGYAIENYLKGLWVHQNPKDLNSHECLPHVLKEHDLNKLCAMTKVEPDAAEKELLRILSAYSTWQGRYAIPMSANANAKAWVNANNLLIVSSKYPGPVKWPDEVYSLIDKIFALVATPGDH